MEGTVGSWDYNAFCHDEIKAMPSCSCRARRLNRSVRQWRFCARGNGLCSITEAFCERTIVPGAVTARSSHRTDGVHGDREGYEPGHSLVITEDGNKETVAEKRRSGGSQRERGWDLRSGGEGREPAGYGLRGRFGCQMGKQLA